MEVLAGVTAMAFFASVMALRDAARVDPFTGDVAPDRRTWVSGLAIVVVLVALPTGLLAGDGVTKGLVVVIGAAAAVVAMTVARRPAKAPERPETEESAVLPMPPRQHPLTVVAVLGGLAALHLVAWSISDDARVAAAFVVAGSMATVVWVVIDRRLRNRTP